MGAASGIGALLVVLGVFPPELQSLEPPEHFVLQYKAECSFPNGTGPGVHYLNRNLWGRQEILRFDSRRGHYEALTELGRPEARKFNSDKVFLEDKRAAVDRFCRHNYRILEPFIAGRKQKPQLQIAPTDADPSSPHTLLVCSVDSFFPAKITVTWLRNGQEEDEGRVVSTGLIRNGDWTFSVQVMLETQPERGDLYACRVEHASLPEPTSVQWGRGAQQQFSLLPWPVETDPSPRGSPETRVLGGVWLQSGPLSRQAPPPLPAEPQSDSARSKMWTGVGGLLLGLAFAVPGLALHLRSRKGDGGSGGSVCWAGGGSSTWLGVPLPLSPAGSFGGFSSKRLHLLVSQAGVAAECWGALLS
ncbi:hypothetical protein lerEdw1_011499 [Lerista edwardsae]|nr:hypothetical protein lerEdw1_011499 [Lerista edwardsae]